MKEYKNINKLKKQHITLCEICGEKTILRPIGIEFLDEGIEPTEIRNSSGRIIPLPKIISFKEALERAGTVHKVCLSCHLGVPIPKIKIHCWN